MVLLTAAWAWVLPWAGPILAKAGLMFGLARARVPSGLGGGALGIVVAAVLGGLLVWRVWAWLDPPPRTYTAAEIEATSLRAENASLKDAVAAQERTLRQRGETLTKIGEAHDRLAAEMEEARAKSGNPGTVVLPANDHWLREWQRRGH